VSENVYVIPGLTRDLMVWEIAGRRPQKRKTWKIIHEMTRKYSNNYKCWMLRKELKANEE
jgi:hypothetical protein